ncbi:MAG: hypothetical protein GTO02_10230, partial [Candidatus Dadabacteria bacterium]|nr:hypothetical protein [Candidatus Dadabacteria bacterium]
TRNGHLEFCIRQNREGILPNYFNQITEGKQIKVEGPFGQFTISNPGSADLLFVATGTGISPIRSIIFSLFSQPFKKEVWLFFGVKNEGEILYRNEFQELQKQHPNFHFIPTLSKPGRWEGEMGYVQEKIKALVKHPETKEAYICGQPLMVKEVRALLAEIGIDQNKTFFEQSA